MLKKCFLSTHEWDCVVRLSPTLTYQGISPFIIKGLDMHKDWALTLSGPGAARASIPDSTRPFTVAWMPSGCCTLPRCCSRHGTQTATPKVSNSTYMLAREACHWWGGRVWGAEGKERVDISSTGVQWILFPLLEPIPFLSLAMGNSSYPLFQNPPCIFTPDICH